MNTEDQHFEQIMNECKKNHKRRKIGFGIFTIILGLLLLVNQIYPNSINFHYVWPSFLIVLGIKSILNSRRHSMSKYC
ncbi:MAG: hypothetical protein HYR91_12935 [Flavobacteriia bacterium]|nr:hypothetical protein [Flavobacteriia bacterium]